MEWNGTLRTFVSRPQPSLNFLYNYNCDQYPSFSGMDKSSSYNNNQEKKKSLTSDQLDSLERSFHEEIKLDPDRKMKLSRELGLQPRQIAVWFQNRRARWKAKQLERLYDILKRDYDVISKEKQKLQDEVMKLKGMLRNQVVSTGYTEISGEETVESTTIRTSDKLTVVANSDHPVAECSYAFNVEEYNTVSSPYWGVQVQLPSYP